MTEYFYAAVLGLVQGIAEFLPISSSGHLVIIGELLQVYGGTSVPSESATMSVALHFGTLMSILVVYRQELRSILQDRRMLALIVLATVPVGIVGLLLKDQVESVFNTPLLAGVGLMVTAGFLLIGRWLQNRQNATQQLSTFGAAVIGGFQAIAIIPGISRSGSTIAAGLACGLSREASARFSFLIAIPAIGGAAVVTAKDLLNGDATSQTTWPPVLLGTVIAFVAGVASLSFLLRIVTADRLHWFAVYCLISGMMTVAWQLSIGI